RWMLVQTHTPPKKLSPTANAACWTAGRNGTAAVARTNGTVARHARRRACTPGTPRLTHHIVRAPTANAPTAPNADGYQLYRSFASVIVSPRSCTKYSVVQLTHNVWRERAYAARMHQYRRSPRRCRTDTSSCSRGSNLGGADRAVGSHTRIQT